MGAVLSIFTAPRQPRSILFLLLSLDLLLLSHAFPAERQGASADKLQYGLPKSYPLFNSIAGGKST